MKRPLIIAFVLVAFVAVAQTVSYFNQGFLRQGTAQLDRDYLGIQGSNIHNWGTNAPWGAGTTNTLIVTNIQAGAITNHNTFPVILDNSLTATNLAVSSVKWIDVPMNYGYATLGPNAPSLTAVTNGSVIQELAFDNGDILYAQAQFQHNVATTNAQFPNFYFEPHVHFTCNGTGLPDATHSNVTWRIEWQLANINGSWVSGTNTMTMGVTNNHRTYMAELGHITNNSVPHISTIFRCRLMRPASALRDYSNAHDVLLDGFDIHIPIGNQNAIGSSSETDP